MTSKDLNCFHTNSEFSPTSNKKVLQTLALESRVSSGSRGRRIQSGKNEEEDKEEDEEGFYPLGLYPQLRNEMKLSITELNIFQTRNLGSFTK